MQVNKADYNVEIKALRNEGYFGMFRFESKKKGHRFAGICGFFEFDSDYVKVYDSLFFNGSYKDLVKCMRTVPQSLQDLYTGNHNLGESLGFRRGREGIPALVYHCLPLTEFNYRPWEERTKFLGAVFDRVKKELPKNITRMIETSYVSSEIRLNKNYNVALKTLPHEFRNEAEIQGAYCQLNRLRSEEPVGFSKPTLVERDLGYLPDWALEMVEEYKK